MLRKILGTIGSLALLAIGSAIMFGILTVVELRSGPDGSRERFLKPVLAWSIESIGAMATGGIAVALGLLLIFLAWKPKQAKGAG